MRVCMCAWGKGGTHSLLPGCHWAGSPDQQPCRPDRRWARLPLQQILCSPSAAPDSAGRSPLEEVEWQERERERREDQWQRINVVGIGGKGEGRQRCKGGNWTSTATAVKWENSANHSVLSSSLESHPHLWCREVLDQRKLASRDKYHFIFMSNCAVLYLSWAKKQMCHFWVKKWKLTHSWLNCSVGC